MTTQKSKLSPELIEKIKRANNLVDIVSEVVVLKKSGANYSGLCPFHSERSPSFSVSENKQLYHCYGCRAGGDTVGFLMQIQNLTFFEAIEELALRAKIAMPVGVFGKGEAGDDKREKLQTAFKLNRFAAAFYNQQLAREQAASQYFKARKIKSETLTEFHAGAAPAEWDALSRHLAAKKAPIEMAVELGLIRKSPQPKPDSIGYFDLFRGRVMFPIIDHRGRVSGFGARTLTDEKPKYLNSPDSITFQKSKVLYGLYQAQKFIREEDSVVVVEGYFDVIGLYQAGIKNVVATCGTALSGEHLNLLSRIASKIIVLFDGDQAGVSATERAMVTGLAGGKVLYGAAMPAGMDPDELVLTEVGKNQMLSLLTGAKPLLDERLAGLAEIAKSGPEAKTQAIKQAAEWLADFSDPVGRQVRVDSVCESLGIGRELLRAALPKGKAQAQPVPTGVKIQAAPAPAGVVVDKTPRPPKSTKLSIRDSRLLFAWVMGAPYAELFADILPKLPKNSTAAELFEHSEVAAFVRDAESEWDEAGGRPSSLPVARYEHLPAQVRSIITEAEMIGESDARAPSQEEIRLALTRAAAPAWARLLQTIRSRLEALEPNEHAGLRQKLADDYLDVQRRMKEFNNFYDEA
jgi:DNA primase